MADKKTPDQTAQKKVVKPKRNKRGAGRTQSVTVKVSKKEKEDDNTAALKKVKEDIALDLSTHHTSDTSAQQDPFSLDVFGTETEGEGTPGFSLSGDSLPSLDEELGFMTAQAEELERAAKERTRALREEEKAQKEKRAKAQAVKEAEVVAQVPPQDEDDVVPHVEEEKAPVDAKASGIDFSAFEEDFDAPAIQEPESAPEASEAAPDLPEAPASFAQEEEEVREESVVDVVEEDPIPEAALAAVSVKSLDLEVAAQASEEKDAKEMAQEAATLLGNTELEELTADEIQAIEDADRALYQDIPILTLDRGDDASTHEGDADDDEDAFEDDGAPMGTKEFYTRVLDVLSQAEDIGIDASAKARVREMLDDGKENLPQLVARDMVVQKVVSKTQMARAIARAGKRKEISSFLDVPPEAMNLRSDLDPRVGALLREARVIPLWKKESKKGGRKPELHLAHESAVRDLMLEANILDIMPGYAFVWHFAQRDVCGAYWLAGENEDVDTSMEAEALLDRIIGNAIDARSSDIHIDPSIKGEAKAIVKYRVDGFVQSKEVITLEQLDRLRIRIENVARMPKVDLNHPNKGAFTRAGFDWRVQIQPHAGRQGPVSRVVIRRLQPEVMPMEQLGYPEYFIQQIKEAAAAPNGVIFWTGPTGSGKTESIHSAVVSVNPMGRGLSVHTIEDPPEKRVPGYAVQMEIAESDPSRSGLELLKSSLRADPDVVIFGEVRDATMAKLVFEAANTGHLVFTTLHTNTSLDAITRLDELGVYGFLVSYIRGITAQRLVRRLCTHCRVPVKGEPDEYTKYVFDKYGVELDGARLFTHSPDGCASCNHTGYHGRIAIAEFLKPNRELVEASTNRDYGNLEEVARRSGWQPMGYMGVLHVKNGITDTYELSQKVLELSGDLLK